MPSRPRVFLDFAVADQPLGRVIFELFSDEVPKTCENFRALCTGEKGLSGGIPLYYKNSISHRIIKDFMIQAGDFTKRNGQGGESIYGAAFADEDLDRPLDAPGLLCMANKGPNTNGSQFFITLRECPHLNGKHVVFGKVIRGYDEVVAKLAEVPVDEKSRPLSTVMISNCGELELRKVAKLASPAPDAEEEEPRRRKSKRSGSADSDEPRKHRKKSKRSKREEEPPVTSKEPAVPTEETEEEYDARLEREENERNEAQRKKDLERLKAQYESEVKTTNGGVRLKGRGRMMYVDPETNSRR